jgi:hypothetical protein
MRITRRHLPQLRALKEALQRQLKDGHQVRERDAGLYRRELTQADRKRLQDLLAACEREIERLEK